MAMKTQIRCDQCEAARINGVFCHEFGCPNEKKTWVAEREEWVKFVDCFDCGFEVEVGTICSCHADDDYNFEVTW